MNAPPGQLSPAPARCRNSWTIKKIVIVLILFLCFFVYFSGTYNWATIMELLGPLYPAKMKQNNEPTETPFREMSVNDIKHLIWNELPETGTFSSIESASSGKHSEVSLEQPRTQYCVGDTLNVLVNMTDSRGIPKAYGGDFILARIHSPKLQASAAGEVTDLRNGSYRVRFRLFWPGAVQVSVLLMHSSEAVGILNRISANNYDKIIYTGTFYHGSEKEESRCGVRLKADEPLCEYRKKEDGEYYACVRPKTLPCSALRTMRSENGPIQNLTADEYLLLSRKNIGVEMKNKFGLVKVVRCQEVTQAPTEKCAVGFGMMSPSPRGYFYKAKWASTSCQNKVFSIGAISKCLEDRTLKLMGDSTVRQWQELLRPQLKGLKIMKPYDNHYYARTVDTKRNITIQWKMHAHPFVTGYNVVKDACGYVARQLDEVEDGDVVVIGVGQHFRPFPLEIFIQRLINIRKAILRLQERSPQTLIVLKVENTRELKSTMTHMSDWLGYVQNLAQKKVFWDLKVVLVDAWDMTTAANTFAIHPNKIVVYNELSLALSYLCHDS